MPEDNVPEDYDPDEQVAVPLRELRATLALLDNLVEVTGSESALAAALAASVEALPADTLVELAEVGAIDSSSQLRLYLLRLSQRLRAVVPGAEAVDKSVAPPPRDVGGLRVRTPSRAAAVEGDELASAFVWWDDITEADVAGYESVLDSARDERPLQRYLARNPRLLVQHLRGGHGRWVISQKRLGSQYVPDFVIADRDSTGFEWYFVELQSPQARLFVPS